MFNLILKLKDDTIDYFDVFYRPQESGESVVQSKSTCSRKPSQAWLSVVTTWMGDCSVMLMIFFKSVMRIDIFKVLGWTLFCTE